MNDRFKFRVWNGAQVIYPNSHGFFEDCFEGDNGHMQTVQLGVLMRVADPNNLTIEQCTGLKDKNGTLIYEGDVIDFCNEWHAYSFTVIWDADRLCFAIKSPLLFDPLVTDPSEVEVIGNIHENLELLEQA